MKLHEFKEQQKKIAKKIRELKNQRKKARNGYVPGLDRERDSYRHRHIAYCLARGRTYEQIERKCDEPPDEYRIALLRKEIELPVREVRDGEAVHSS